MKKRIVIISPSFNSYPYIKNNIISVGKLGGKIEEHIIMDGGSNDGTVDLLRSVAVDSNLKWISEADNGQTDAINKALRASSGDLVGWLNSDDEYCPDILPEIVEVFQSNPDVDIVHGDIEIIDQNSRIIGISKGGAVNSPADLLVDNPIKQPGLFFRRSVFERLGDLDEDLCFVMDREYWLRALIENRRFHYLSRPLARFRLISGTKTFESNEMFRKEWIEVLKRYEGKLGVDLVRFKHAIDENMGSYFYQLALRNVGFKFSYIKLVALAFYYSPALRKNLGFYKVALLGLFGRERNRYSRFAVK